MTVDIDPTEGTEPEIDTTPEGGDEGGEGDDDSAPKVNPAWEEAWQDVPEPIREAQREVFEKWDRNVQHAMSKYAPYRQFEEQGLDPQSLQQALNIQDAILNNPREFWDRMAEMYGFASGAQAQAAIEGQDDDEEVDDVTRLEREIAEMKQWREEQQQLTYQQEQQYEQEMAQAQVQQQVESELDVLGQRFGNFDREAVIERALANAMRGGNPSVENAYFEVKQREDQWAASRKKAPRVLGSGGGSAPAAQSKPMTADEQREAAMALAKRLSAG